MTKGTAHHRGNKSTTKDESTLGSIWYVKEVERDRLREPFVVCDVNKRRKCDSYYIQVNRELEKRIEKAIEYIYTNCDIDKNSYDLLDILQPKVTKK